MESSPKPAASETEPQKGAEIRYPGIGMMALIWTVIGALTSVRYQLVSPSKPAEGAVGELSSLLGGIACYYPWIALTPAVFRIEARFPLGSGRWVRNLALLAMLSLPVSLLASGIAERYATQDWPAIQRGDSQAGQGRKLASDAKSKTGQKVLWFWEKWKNEDATLYYLRPIRWPLRNHRGNTEAGVPIFPLVGRVIERESC